MLEVVGNKGRCLMCDDSVFWHSAGSESRSNVCYEVVVLFCVAFNLSTF